MKSLTKITSKLSRCLFLALFLALAPAALASNTWYVDGVNGNDNNNCQTPQTACQTIGHAISLASKGDTIMVAPATYTENLSFNISLKIIGSDAATTIVDGNQAGTVFNIYNRHPDAHRIWPHVLLSNLTIRNGSNNGVVVQEVWVVIDHDIVTGNSGGGISSYGTLTINNSTITENSGDGINNNLGYGPWMAINNSTIAGNSGGGINGGVMLRINNSTITENAGGGTNGGWHLTINSSTITENSGGGINNPYWSAVLQNSIVANNTSGGNCSGAVISNGYNLSSDNTCNFNGPGDVIDTKPKLGALGNYGGPTQTIKLLWDSPAIDAGNPNGCTDGNGKLLTTDQRGFPRPGKHKTIQRCDIGAFERQTD